MHTCAQRSLAPARSLRAEQGCCLACGAHYLAAHRNGAKTRTLGRCNCVHALAHGQAHVCGGEYLHTSKHTCVHTYTQSHLPSSSNLDDGCCDHCMMWLPDLLFIRAYMVQQGLDAPVPCSAVLLPAAWREEDEGWEGGAPLLAGFGSEGGGGAKRSLVNEIPSTSAHQRAAQAARQWSNAGGPEAPLPSLPLLTSLRLSGACL